MPNTPIAECAHLHLNQWLDDSNEWLSESTADWHDWVLPSHKGMKAVVNTAIHHRHKRQVRGLIVYVDGICELATALLSGNRAKAREESELVVVRSDDNAKIAQHILQDLETMLNEEDEPDFQHRPTDYAHGLARQVLEGSYTHYIGAAPIPAIAPDGDGGLVVEWELDSQVVRLIISADSDGKSYIYSRHNSRSLVERSISGLVLAQQLCATFAPK